MTKAQLLQVLPSIIDHLKAEDFIVHTYAAVCIERILYMKENRKPLFTQSDLQPVLQSLLLNLFGILERCKSADKLAENEHVMKSTFS